MKNTLRDILALRQKKKIKNGDRYGNFVRKLEKYRLRKRHE